MKDFNWREMAEVEWDSRADFWHERSRNMWEKGSRSTIIPFIQQHIVEGNMVLDVGCGDGYGSYLLKKAGYKVTGVDISNEMINHAKKALPEGEIVFKKADINELSFPEESYDALIAINVLEWTEDPLHALNEMIRVTKDGGHLCIGILGPTAGPRANSFSRLYGEDSICNTMMPWELRKLATEIGLQQVDDLGVYKKEVNPTDTEHLSSDLKQALSFMWVYLFKKN
ncbi:class I SAM-dependent methyltransferase [Oceanobacillus manasiensis]|uniref:class I SAM-dependent methyltransferase n=1 Tax=Oceanobacillus manasiensis TaxID=586413 RepID=UPI0005A7FCBF|nr:class I SAM-dependent methyltransferase [Oceanobacillus manasiensis]